MATFCVNTGLQALWKVVYDLDQSFQADFIPHFLQRSFQRLHIRVGFRARFFFENRPYGVIERVQIRGIGWPFTIVVSPMIVDFDEIGAVFAKIGLGLYRLVSWSLILLKSFILNSKK